MLPDMFEDHIQPSWSISQQEQLHLKKKQCKIVIWSSQDLVECQLNIQQLLWFSQLIWDESVINDDDHHIYPYKNHKYHKYQKISITYIILWWRRWAFPGANSSSAMSSSSNCTLISMKGIWDEGSKILYPFASSAYPTIMHSLLCGCKSFLFSDGILAEVLEQKILKWEIFGLWPNQASYGVSPSIDLWRDLFWMYATKLMDYGHRLGFKSLASNIQVAISLSSMFLCSTTPFCCGV